MDPTPSATSTVRRHQDVVALSAGIVVLLLTGWVASFDTVSGLEEESFRVFNDRPDWLEAPLWPVMQVGTAAAVVISAVAVAVVWRRGRLSAALLIAGGLAWITAKVVKEIVGRERPVALIDDVNERPAWDGLGFVSGHAAVAFALATAASPHVPGRWKWLLWTFPVATALLRLYTGAHLPLDVVGGAALGVALGAGANMALGTPPQPSADDTRAAVP